MAADEKKLLVEYNKLRESNCWLEEKSESTWLRPQRRHYPHWNQASQEKYIEKKKEYNSGRTSWIKITPEYKEKRHFPEKNNAIFG
ncbi:spermatogenesis-associated protein 45 [Pogona vitticeps]|uniref:Spermatogenesis-associated protein 45 n=1 Tax=Pogona vitticeps TaxID=103695 RepID=A0ABM5FLL9_9SAUR